MYAQIQEEKNLGIEFRRFLTKIRSEKCFYISAIWQNVLIITTKFDVDSSSDVLHILIRLDVY